MSYAEKLTLWIGIRRREPIPEALRIYREIVLDSERIGLEQDWYMGY